MAAKSFYHCLILVLLSSIFLPVSAAAAQKKERKVKTFPWPNEPVKITKMKVKGQPIESDKNFPGDDDWLNGLTITIENSSGKWISFIAIRLIFLRPNSDASVQDPPLGYSLPYGHIPPPGTPALPNKPKDIAPGKTIDIVLSGLLYDDLKEALQETNYHAGVEHVELKVGSIYFDDGTMWENGKMHIRDPNNPQQWQWMEESKRKVPTRDIGSFSVMRADFNENSLLMP